MITTVTLNASIDKAYQMDQKIVNGTVMRVASCMNTAGGKGLNVARVVKLCGEKVHAIGLCGGFNGMYLKDMLKKDGIEESFIVTDKETRSCINILDEEFGSTEYLEPGELVEAADINRFMEHFDEILPKSDIITISGSAPKGCPNTIYAKLISKAKKQGKIVILDTSKELLVEGIKALPTMIKPNIDELEYLFGRKPKDLDEITHFAIKLHDDGIPIVAISLGKDGALLVCDEGIFKGSSPKVDVVNTVGCGDSFVAAFAVALMRKKESKDALRYAISIATSNAMSLGTGSFDKSISEDIESKVVIEEILLENK